MEKLLLIGAGEFGRAVLEQACQQYYCILMDNGNTTDVDHTLVIRKMTEMDTFYKL